MVLTKFSKASLTESIRRQIRFIPLATSGAVVHCLAGHLLPAGTIKTAWVAPTLEELKEDGMIPPAGVCEASSGSTARAAAWACHQLGIPFTAFMPETSGPKAVAGIEQYGGTVHLTPGLAGIAGAISAMKESAGWHGYLPLDQFANPCNPGQFARVVGPELITILDPALPVYVPLCTGTGGTLVGLSRSLREHGFCVHPVRVYPVSEDGGRTCEVAGVTEPLPRFVVEDRFGMDSWEEMWVRDGQVRASVARLRAMGHRVGPSSGANVHVAERFVARFGEAAQYLTVFHDSATRYES